MYVYVLALALLVNLVFPDRAPGQALRPFQDPPDIRWRRIRTPHFEVIFPAPLNTEAQRVAFALERVHGPVAKTLGVKIRRTPVVLRNQAVQANSFISLGPRISVWFSTPPQDPLLGTQDWYELLAVHEMRRVAQYDKLDYGFTRVAGQLYGAQVRQMLIFFSAPAWFWEGDAIGAETALTGGGRGRLPAFDMEIRALLLTGRLYPYYKAWLRSYKDWYPDSSYLGYLLTTHVRRAYGPETWSRVLTRSAKTSFYPFAFSRALKKVTGQSLTSLYAEAMGEVATYWRQQLEGLELTPARHLNSTPRQGWTSYRFPQYAPNRGIIALKEGQDQSPTLVRLERDGREKELFQLATLNKISVGAGKVVWTQLEPDRRWGGRDFSVVVVHNLHGGRTVQLTHRTKLFAADLSPDGKRIAVVEFTPERTCALVVLDATNGAELGRYPSPGNDFLQTPAWSADGGQLVCTRQEAGGTAIAVVDLASGRWRNVIPAARETVSRPVFFRHYVLYNSPYTGIDNIWAVDLLDHRRYQITSRPFGAFNPTISPDSTALLFQDYTADGYNVAEMALDPSTWIPLEAGVVRPVRYYEPLIAQEQGGDLFATAPVADPRTQSWPVKDYHSLSHIFDVHNWFVVPLPPNVSCDILSVDKLNTAALKAGVRYNTNENAGSLQASASYAGFWPIVDVGGRFGRRSSVYRDGAGAKHAESWHEDALRVGLRVPLDLSSGIYSSTLVVGSGAEVTRIDGRSYVEPFAKGNGHFASLAYYLRYDRRRASSTRDLYPLGGENLDLVYQHTPHSGDYQAALFSARGALFFPGWRRHQGLRLQAGYERQVPQNYRFASELPFPRGYDPVFHHVFYRGTIDYAIPLFYPDLNLGALFYCKRLKATFFGDWGLGQDRHLHQTYSATGVELSMDFHLFSLPIELTAGVRGLYRLRDRSSGFEPVFLGVAL